MVTGKLCIVDRGCCFTNFIFYIPSHRPGTITPEYYRLVSPYVLKIMYLYLYQFITANTGNPIMLASVSLGFGDSVTKSNGVPGPL